MAGVAARSSHERFPFYLCFFLPFLIVLSSVDTVLFFLYFTFLLFVWRGFQRVRDLIPFCTGVLYFHEGRGFGRLAFCLGNIGSRG